MRTLCTFIFALSVIYNAGAQIVVNNASFPKVGDQLRTYTTDQVENVRIGDAGENKIYDFNNLSGGQLVVQRWMDKSTGKNQALFPDANVVVKVDSSEGELYAKILSSRIELVGFTSDEFIFASDLAINYKTRPIFRRSPMFYETNSRSEGSFFIAFSAAIIPDSLLASLPIKPDSIRLTFKEVTVDTIDGWGKVKLQGKTFDVLREKAISISENKLELKLPFLGWIDLSTIFGGGGGGPVGPLMDTTYLYNYYTNTKKEILVSVSMDAEQNPESVTYADLQTSNLNEVSFSGTFNVFPNPADQFTKMSATGLTEAEYTLKITGVDGRIWVEYPIKNQETFESHINLQDYPKGIYVATLQNKNGQMLAAQTFSIVR